MQTDPNFPENLAIKPSIYPSKSISVHSSGASHPALDHAFGITAQEHSIQKYGIAGRVWEAAYAMNTYLEAQTYGDYDCDPPFTDSAGKSDIPPLTVIELGSGTGVVAAFIAQLFAPTGWDLVIATDLPDVCPLLEQNLFGSLEEPIEPCPTDVKNGVLVRPLTWGDEQHALEIAGELGLMPEANDRARYLTHIVCSDLVYFPELLAPLLRTLIHLTSPPYVPPHEDWEKRTKIVISYKIRSLSKEAPFWSAFGAWFSFEPVMVRPKSQADKSWRRFGSDSDDFIFIFIAYRRPMSLNWEVPQNDHDLIHGKYGDDTFESLLFMTMNEDT